MDDDGADNALKAWQQKALPKYMPRPSMPKQASGPKAFLRREPQRPLFWIAEKAALEAVCLKLCQEAFIGLDVETTLSTQSLCLMQLATPSATYLVDALAFGKPTQHSLSPLSPLLERCETKKLIHHAPFEERVLAACGLSLAGVVDTLLLSRKLRGRNILGGHSLSVVCERELGSPLDKREQTSNWQRRPLSRSQITYAALDAEVLLQLWEIFSRGPSFF
ncbi:MAG: hypothetical protein FWG75_02640 [Cystobacterineae bacterium]|nr:hypothetical protein [Cystobacterineae bacterium]